MKRSITWEKRSVRKWAAVLLWILAAIWILSLLFDTVRIKTEELYLTPWLNDARGWDIYTLENGIRRDISTEEAIGLEAGSVFYLSRILTTEQESAGYTFLLLDFYRPCAVFLDGALLYTNCPMNGLQIDAVSFPQDYPATPPAPGEWVRCTLPAHFAGRRLTIATALYDPSMPGIVLSSYKAESEKLITDTGSELMPAAGSAVITLLFSGIWLFAFFQGVRIYPSLLLISCALIRTLSHLRQFAFLSPSSYAIDSPLAVFIPVIELLLPLYWLLLQMKSQKGRAIFGAVLGISAAVSLIHPIWGLFGGLPVYSSFLENKTILCCPLAALPFCAVWEAVRKKNHIFALLLSGFCITACLTAVLYVGSLCGGGFYASQIANVFQELSLSVTTLFFYWCAVILFALSTILALYQIIQRITQMHTDLVLQTEHVRQLDNRLSSQKDFYEAKLTHENALRALRHDMTGHLSTLAMLLQDAKTAEARKYLNSIAEYHKEQAAGIFSQNPYMNAVLQNYAAKCRKQHIELICHIGIGEHELPAAELCLILNNALENALENSLTVPEGERIIKVQAAVRQNLFLLRVSNRFDGRLTIEDGLPVSAKEGKEHGYGLSNISQAAGRRDGHMEYHVQNGYFVLDVTFSVE